MRTAGLNHAGQVPPPRAGLTAQLSGNAQPICNTGCTGPSEAKRTSPHTQTSMQQPAALATAAPAHYSPGSHAPDGATAAAAQPPPLAYQPKAPKQTPDASKLTSGAA